VIIYVVLFQPELLTAIDGSAPQNSTSPSITSPQGFSFDLFTVVFFIVAGPSVGVTLTMLHRSIDDIRHSIFGYRDLTAEKDEVDWIHKYKRLRIVCTDNERVELEETSAYWDFTRSTAIGVLILAMYYVADKYILTQNDDFSWFYPIGLFVFSIILFTAAYFQQKKSLNPLLNELREKYGLQPQEWISIIYKSLVGREPSNQEEKYVKARLLRGDSIDVIIEGILSSYEFGKRNAYAFCKHFLDTESDVLVQEYTQKITEKSLQEIIVELCVSSRFQSKYNQRDSYIKQLFEKILYRAPSPTELREYIPQAASDEGKKRIIRRLIKTKEFAKLRVNSYYDALRYQPLQSDLDKWIGMIETGTSLQEIMKRILVSTMNSTYLFKRYDWEE
jgi:hypothetical protein